MEKDISKNDMQEELRAADEETLEKLSRRFSYRDLKEFFRWRAVLGEFSENMELRRYVVHECAVFFYLACEVEGVFLENLHGLARERYERGKEVTEGYNKIFEDCSSPFGELREKRRYWWEDS